MPVTCLEPNERKAICLAYKAGLTNFTELGEIHLVSRQTIRRVLVEEGLIEVDEETKKKQLLRELYSIGLTDPAQVRKRLQKTVSDGDLQAYLVNMPAVQYAQVLKAVNQVRYARREAA